MTAEFGHFGSIQPGFCIDAWGAGPFVMRVGKKEWRFEDSDRFGPLFVNRDCEPTDKDPGERSPFWPLYNKWRVTGRRLEPDGITCLVDPLQPHKLRRIGGRHAMLVEEGDEGGLIEFVDAPEAKP